MVDLALNRRLNTRNILLAQGTRGEHVGYPLPNGGRRFVPWLGFIERVKARAMKAGRPVRLADITRIGTSNGYAPEWQDLPADSFVHGCLTEWGGLRGVRGERVSGAGSAAGLSETLAPALDALRRARSANLTDEQSCYARPVRN